MYNGNSCGSRNYSGSSSYGSSSNKNQITFGNYSRAIDYEPSCKYSSTNVQEGSIDSLISDSVETTRRFFNPINLLYSAKYSAGTYLTKRTQNIEFGAEDFLNPNRPATIFVQEETSQVTDAIKQTFKLITNEELPNNLRINILNEEEFIKAHSIKGGKWSDGIMGFSLNSQGKGINEVFAKKDFLDRLMLTIGHEIGHVMSPSLKNQHDEEAKAFAFSLAWMQTIVDNNIAGLSQNINPMPAKNGLHNVAFDFVAQTINTGKKAIEVFKELILGNISIFNKLEIINLT